MKRSENVLYVKKKKETGRKKKEKGKTCCCRSHTMYSLHHAFKTFLQRKASQRNGMKQNLIDDLN